MAIQFPVGAEVGREFSSAGVTWKYDGEKWVSQTTATEGDSVFRYQEGTWTPVMEQAAPPYSTYTGFTGVTSKWTRVGNIVTLYARFNNAAARPADADPVIVTVGLPYIFSTGSEPVGPVMFSSIAGTYGSISAYLDPSNANPAHTTGQIVFYKTTAAADWDTVKVKDLTSDNSSLIFTITYITDDTTFAVPAGIGATVTVDEKTGGSGGSEGGGASVSTGPTPPTSPSNGDLWYDDTDTMRLYIYFDDGNSSQWVDASPASDGLWRTDGTTISPTKDGDNLKVNGDITANSYNTGQLAGFRNQLINSNFTVCQRFPFDATQNGSSQGYAADRWYIYNNGSGTYDVAVLTTQFSDPSLAAGGGNSLRVKNATTNYAFRQAIEASDATPGPFQQGTTWTVSLYSTFVPSIKADWSTAGVTPGGGDFAVITDWLVGTNLGNNRYSVTFTINVAPPAGTNCLLLSIQNAADPDSDQEIAGCQIEPGPVTTPLEFINQQTQLANCQRYYEKFPENSWYGMPMNQLSNAECVCTIFYAEKRVRPNITFEGTWLYRESGSASNNRTASPNSGIGYGTRTSSSTIGTGVSDVKSANWLETGNLIIDAEL